MARPSLFIDYGNNAGEPFKFIVHNKSDDAALDVDVEVTRSDGRLVRSTALRLEPGDQFLADAGEVEQESPSPAEIADMFKKVDVSYSDGVNTWKLGLKWRKSKKEDGPMAAMSTHVPQRDERKVEP